MDYYTSTEFMYETDNVPHYAGSLLEAASDKYSERMLILLDIYSMFEICFADDLDSDNYCYGVYTFAEFGLNDNDALSYLITQDELTQFQEYYEELKMSLNHIKNTVKNEITPYERVLEENVLDELGKNSLIKQIEDIKDSYKEDLLKFQNEINDCKKSIEEILTLQTKIEEKIEKYIIDNKIKPRETKGTISSFIMEKS